MFKTDYVTAYEQHVAGLQGRLQRDAALRAAVGGNFAAVGKLEFHLLRSLGLKSGDCMIDVGCGSGRLACQLAALPGVRYLGTDVVGELLGYAAELCGRPDFSFVRTDGTNIPSDDAVADFVCFFSVFTHLLHEDTFRYIRETERVLKPGGRMVMSFLEFKLPLHWPIFAASVEAGVPGAPLNQFIDRDAIASWAEHAGLVVESVRDGDRAHIPIPEEIVFEEGPSYREFGTFGQSVAVLRKPERA